MLQERIIALLLKSANLPSVTKFSSSIPIAKQNCMDSKRFLLFMMSLEVEFSIDLSSNEDIFDHLETIDNLAEYFRSKGIT